MLVRGRGQWERDAMIAAPCDQSPSAQPCDTEQFNVFTVNKLSTTHIRTFIVRKPICLPELGYRFRRVLTETIDLHPSVQAQQFRDRIVFPS